MGEHKVCDALTVNFMSGSEIKSIRINLKLCVYNIIICHNEAESVLRDFLINQKVTLFVMTFYLSKSCCGELKLIWKRLNFMKSMEGRVTVQEVPRQSDSIFYI